MPKVLYTVEIPEEIIPQDFDGRQIVEIGVATLVSGPMLKRVDEALKDTIEKHMAEAFARKLFDASLIPILLQLKERRDENSSVEFYATVDAVFRPFLLPKALQLKRQGDEYWAFLHRRRWRVLWDIIRGRTP